MLLLASKRTSYKFLQTHKAKTGILIDAICMHCRTASSTTAGTSLVVMPEKFREVVSYKIKGCKDLRGMEDLVRGSGQYFNFINLTGFMTRLAKLQIRQKPDTDRARNLLVKIESLFTEKMIESMNERALANCLWAIAKLKLCHTENSQTLFMHLLDVAQTKDGYRGQGVSNILWAMAIMDAEHLDAVTKFANLAVLRARDMNPQELTMVLWSTARMNFYNFGLYQKVLHEQLFREKGLVERDIANTLWACNKMRHFSKGYLEEVLTQMHVLHLRFQTRFLSPQICSQVFQAVATFNYTHRPAIRCFIQYVLDEGDGRNIMDALYALTILQYPSKHLQLLTSALNKAWKPQAKVPPVALSQFYLTYKIIKQKLWYEKFPKDLVQKATQARQKIVQEDLSLKSSWLVDAVVVNLKRMGAVHVKPQRAKFLDRLELSLLESGQSSKINPEQEQGQKTSQDKQSTSMDQNLQMEEQLSKRYVHVEQNIESKYLSSERSQIKRLNQDDMYEAQSEDKFSPQMRRQNTQQTQIENVQELSRMDTKFDSIQASYQVVEGKMPKSLLKEIREEGIDEDSLSEDGIVEYDAIDEYKYKNILQDVEFETLVISEKGDYVIDIVINYKGKKLALVCNSRTCYSQSPPFRELGPSAAFRRFLQGEEWKVATIPFHEWLENKSSREKKYNYLLNKLDAALENGEVQDNSAILDWRAYFEDVNFRVKRMDKSKDLMQLASTESMDFNQMNISACITRLGQLANIRKVDPRTIILDMRFLAKMLDDNVIKRFDARQVASCAWAFGKTGYGKEQGQDLLIKLLKRGMELSPKAIIPQTNSLLIWSIAKGNIQQRPKIMEYYLSIMMSNTQGFESQNYSNILWAMATLGYFNENVVKHVLQHFCDNIKEYRKQEFENILWAQRTLDYYDKNTLTTALSWSDAVAKNTQTLSPGAAVELLISLAYFDVERKQAVHPFLKWFAEQGRFKACIAAIFYCATFEYDINEHPLLREIIQRVNQMWSSQLDFSDQQLQWLYWGQLIWWSKGEMSIFPQQLLQLCEQPWMEQQSRELKARQEFQKQVGLVLTQMGWEWEGGRRIETDSCIKVDIKLSNGTMIGLAIDDDYSTDSSRQELWRLRTMRQIMRNMQRRFVVINYQDWEQQGHKENYLQSLLKPRR